MTCGRIVTWPDTSPYDGPDRGPRWIAEIVEVHPDGEDVLLGSSTFHRSEDDAIAEARWIAADRGIAIVDVVDVTGRRPVAPGGGRGPG